jgi:hypothetical protein
MGSRNLISVHTFAPATNCLSSSKRASALSPSFCGRRRKAATPMPSAATATRSVMNRKAVMGLWADLTRSIFTIGLVYITRALTTKSDACVIKAILSVDTKG